MERESAVEVNGNLQNNYKQVNNFWNILRPSVYQNKLVTPSFEIELLKFCIEEKHKEKISFLNIVSLCLCNLQ